MPWLPIINQPTGIIKSYLAPPFLPPFSVTKKQKSQNNYQENVLTNLHVRKSLAE